MCDFTTVTISGHSFSRTGDTGTRTVSPTQPYGATAALADGTVLAMSTRERPHLLFHPATGEPVALSNGVCPTPHCPPSAPIDCKISGDRATYTLIVPLAA